MSGTSARGHPVVVIISVQTNDSYYDKVDEIRHLQGRAGKGQERSCGSVASTKGDLILGVGGEGGRTRERHASSLEGVIIQGLINVCGFGE